MGKDTFIQPDGVQFLVTAGDPLVSATDAGGATRNNFASVPNEYVSRWCSPRSRTWHQMESRYSTAPTRDSRHSRKHRDGLMGINFSPVLGILYT